MSVEVQVLGPVRVLVDGQEVELGGPRNRALVARLALDAGRAVSPSLLIDDLWGEDVPADATNALQSIVSRTRRRLPDGTLRSVTGGYRLDAVLDADVAEAAVQDGRATEALGLWRGEELADLSEFPFAREVATRLTDLHLTATEADLTARVAAGGDPSLSGTLAMLTAAHPYRDTLWLLRLRALAAEGRTSEALAAYEQHREQLADDLGADPSPQLQQLHLEILRGDTGAAPAPARRAHRSTLPVGLTTFVGRDGAIAELGEALGSQRLVTILGPGGAGKTRLSVEAARAVQDEFEEVTLVELAPVSDGSDLPATVLAALGLLEVATIDRRRAGGLVDERARLLDAVADSRRLLVLDNCEHLVDDVAALTADLLSHAPALTVLTTSREPLRILGEFVYPLDSLAQAPAGATADQALSYSAVELFVQRASAVDRTFALDESTLPAVLEICRRLDGQPLALELAAARLRTLTVGQVAARLGDRFRLLTGGSRTALPRHRTLRAVVEWSWDLLDDVERDVAERVAVFPAGVTARAAAAVTDGLDEDTAADVIESLVDKSLLVPVRSDRPRFRMLETLREYGTEQLVERGIVQQVRSLMLDHVLSFATEREPDLRGPLQLAAFADFDAERGNLTAALRFAVDQQDRARSARLLALHGWYWSTRNQEAEVFTWTDTVVAMPGRAAPSDEVALLILQIVACLASDRREDVPDLAAQILEIWDEGQASGFFVELAMVAIEFFDGLGGRVLPEPADPWTRAAAIMVRVMLRDNAGTPGGIAEDLARAVELFRGVGDRWGIATALSQQGVLLAYEGRFEEALRVWDEAVPLLEELGSEEDLEYTSLRQLGLRMSTADDAELEALLEVLQQRLRDAEESGSRRAVFLARLSFAQYHRVTGNPAQSISDLEQLDQMWASFDDNVIASRQMRGALLASLVLAKVDAGELADADRVLETATSVAIPTDDMPVVATVAVASAWLAAEHGDLELAARRLGASVQIRGADDLSAREPRLLRARLGDALGVEKAARLEAEGRALPRHDALVLTLGTAGPQGAGQALRR